MNDAIATIGDNASDRRTFWSGRINAAWNKSLEGIFEAGRFLAESKSELAHGEFMAMVKDDLCFGQSTAAKLMKVARDPRITNSEFVPNLPPSWGTLHELTKLSDEQFEGGLESGLINPNMTGWMLSTS